MSTNEESKDTDATAKCIVCGEPMPKGEDMFLYHGFSGPCPMPPLPTPKLARLMESTLAGIDNQILRFLHTLGRIELLLLSVEKHVMATSTGIERLQGVQARLEAKLTEMQASYKTMSDALDAANTRMETDLKALRDAAGSNNVDAINAVSTSLEGTLSQLQNIQDSMNAAATAEAGLDVVPPTPAPATAPAAFIISPTGATVAAGGSQQFSASQDANWTAKNGTIDANGKYTAPVGTGQTADTVTASSKADPLLIATASITIQ